ncbi:Der1-like family-domain-containing protein [Scheffersomyces xylosifermentans]|uniref:Der1-like family-domain-containing protein n=1 Tax=Scheffersomyces xylosifermentans TaxID=1304137 RepID=UPI00315C8C0D
MANSFAKGIRNIPPVTRFFTVSTVLVCFGQAMGLLDTADLMAPLRLFWDYSENTYRIIRSSAPFIKKFQAFNWLLFQSYRFFTSFLIPEGLLVYKPLSAIFDIYFFYTFANHVENYDGKFHRNFPDCLWFTLVAGTIIVLTTITYSALFDFDHFPIQHEMMLSCITYIWSRSSKNSQINFLGLIPIKAYYLPFFNLFLKLLIGGRRSFLDTAIGIFGGYIYLCIQSDTLPIYNLFPGSYGSLYNPQANNNGRRVGNDGFHDNAADYIEDSIFDKGYLKAPLWLYKLLNYPSNNSKRSTAFYPRYAAPVGNLSHAARKALKKDDPPTSETTTFSWFGGDGKTTFKGKGHRLGD